MSEPRTSDDERAPDDKQTPDRATRTTPELSEGVKSALTLLALAALVALAAMWGWSAATKPFPTSGPAPLCTDSTITEGTKVFREDVVVSVYNGSKRSRLAAATQEMLVDRGFVAGETGNAPAQVPTTQIYSSDPENPAARLVKRQFRDAEIVPGEELGPGVVVVVGESFKELRTKEVESVKAKADATVCVAGGG